MTGVSLKVWIKTASSPAVYYPGSVINGDVVIELSRRISSISSIMVKLPGKVYTHWEESETHGKYTHTITYTCSETILDVCLDNILPSVRGVSAQPTKLEPGRHKFPFTIRLSKNLALPTSYEYTGQPLSGLSGYIRYVLVAKITLTSGQNYTAVKGITVISHIDVNTPQLLRPLSRSKEKTVCCLCCASGPVSLTASTDRGAYCSGESIHINVDTENYSTRRIVGIRASLKQTTTFYGNPEWHGLFRSTALTRRPPKTKEIDKVIKTIEGPADSQNISLPIPVTVPSITNCNIIQVFYTLDVYLVLRNALNLHVELPIVIGTIPFRGPIANPTLDSAGHLHTQRNCFMIDYAPASNKQIYIGLDAYIQGDLYYTPLYTFCDRKRSHVVSDYMHLGGHAL